MPPASLPAQLVTRDRERLRRYSERLAFYDGTQWEGTPRRRERRLTFNYARTMIDKVSAYVLSGLDTAVDPPTADDAGRAYAARIEQLLHHVGEANNLDRLDYDSEVDCSILGDGAFKVTWDGAAGQVRITAPDVQGLFAWWHPWDLATPYRVAQRWTAPNEQVAALLGAANPLKAPDQSVQVIEDWTADRLDLWVDQQLADSRPNPYRVLPYVLYPNIGRPKSGWGESDLTPLISTARELNRALSQLSQILELSGSPIAVLENVTDSQDIAVAPGAVWDIPPDAKAYLLDLLQGGGVRLHVDYVDLLYRTLHDLGEVPRTAFGQNQQGLSGVALNTELDPLLKKVQRKRLIRAAAFRRRNELVLRLLERFTGEATAPYRTRTLWGPVLPRDRAEETATNTRLVAAAIYSRRRAADNLGVEDPDAELAQWLAEEERIRPAGADPGKTSSATVTREGG